MDPREFRGGEEFGRPQSNDLSDAIAFPHYARLTRSGDAGKPVRLSRKARAARIITTQQLQLTTSMNPLHITIPHLAALLTLAAATSLTAASRTWDGGDPFNTNWSDTDNWNGSFPVTAGDELSFPAGPLDKNMVNDLAAGTELDLLVFTGGGYTISGNGFTLGANGIVMNVIGSALTTIQSPVGLTDSQTWGVWLAGDRLTVNGMVSSPGHTLQSTGTGVINLGAGCSGHGGALVVDMNEGSGGGVRFMSGSSSNYTGATTVRSGVLETGGVSTASVVTVESGGKLGGNGTVYRVSNAGGIIQPGLAAGSLTDTAGIITITSGLSSDGTGVFIFGIGGSAPGTGYDQLKVNGTVNLGDTTMWIAANNGYVPSSGVEHIIISNDGTDPVTGTFHNFIDGEYHQLVEGAGLSSGGRGFYISYRGGDGNDVSLRAARLWSGAGGDGLWSNPDNWDGPTAPVSGDSLFFPWVTNAYAADMQNDLPVDTLIQHIASAGYFFDLPGNRIRLAAGITVTRGLFGWDLDITATAPLTITGYDSSMFLGGDIDNGGHALTLTVANTNPADSFHGAGLNGVISGSGSLTKRGNGRAGTNGSNTYTGGTLVAEGRYRVSDTASLGAVNAPCVVEAGAELVFDTNNVEVLTATLAQPITLRGTLHCEGEDGAVMTFSGPVTVEGTQAKVIADVAVTLSGPVSGAGALTKTGPATLRFSGGASNTFTGGFTALEGNVELAKSSGSKSLAGPVTFGFGSTPVAMDLLFQEQFASTAQVSIGPKGILDLNSLDCGIASLDLTGGTIIGAPGKLRLAGGLTSHAAAQSALISANLFSAPLSAVWIVEDGAAVPDLKVSGSVETTVANPTVNKSGAGSVQFMGSQQLQRALVSMGEVTWDAGSLTKLDCNGGIVTGAGSCGQLTGMSGGGAISPGGSTAATFHSTSLGLHPSTIARFDLFTSTPGTGFDQIISASQPVLNNATLQLIVRPGFLAAPGTAMMLVENTTGFGVSGTFAGLPEGKHFSVSGRLFRISYQGGSGNDITLTAAAGTAKINSFTTATVSGPAGTQTSIAITASGAFGLDYLLESSTDLTTWSPVAQQPATAGGILNFSLLQPNSARRFFRITTL